MVRGVEIPWGIVHGQSNDFRERLTDDINETFRKNLFVCPLSMAKIQIADLGHGLDVGGNSGAKLSAFCSFERVWAVGIITPSKIRISNAQFGKDTVKH